MSIRVMNPMELFDETRKVQFDPWVDDDGTIEFSVYVYSGDGTNGELDPSFEYSRDISDGSVWNAPFTDCREDLEKQMANLGVSKELVGVSLAAWAMVYQALLEVTRLARCCNSWGLKTN